MAKYRKKPVVVDISDPWQKHGDLPEVEKYNGNNPGGKCEHCENLLALHGVVATLEGYHIVCPGDSIVTGVEGEKYPIKPNIKAKTYDAVDANAAQKEAILDSAMARMPFCADHRDKVRGKPCRECRVERLEKTIRETRKKLLANLAQVRGTKEIVAWMMIRAGLEAEE